MAPVVEGLPTQNLDPKEDMALVRQGEANQIIPNLPKNLEFPNGPIFYSDAK